MGDTPDGRSNPGSYRCLAALSICTAYTGDAHFLRVILSPNWPFSPACGALGQCPCYQVRLPLITMKELYTGAGCAC